MTGIICSLDMNDVDMEYSSNPLLNVGYRNNDFSLPYCDFETIPNCPQNTKYCGIHLEGSSEVCSGNGTCRFDAEKKKNYCECNEGREGNECEYEKRQIGEENCVRKDGYCYLVKQGEGLLKKNWRNAREWCKSWHPASDLAIIPNEEINNYLRETIGPTTGAERFWIGALDAQEGDIKWIDHSSSIETFRPFQDGGDEGNKPIGEDCVDFRPKHGKWSTTACDIQSWWICGLDVNDENKLFSSNMWVNAYYLYSKNSKSVVGCNCDPSGGKLCPCGGNVDCFSC